MTTRDTAGVILNPELSAAIWTSTQAASAVMSLSTRIDLPGAGTEVQLITADPSAAWTAEGDEIAVSEPGFGNKVMRGYKLGVVVPFSNEFKRDKARLYAEVVNRLPGVLAAKFDATVMHGTAPGSDFDVLSGADALPLTAADAYDNLVAIDGAVSDADGVLNGFALSPRARSILLSAKDGDQRPLLISDVQNDGAVTSLLGAPARFLKQAYKAGTPNTLGYAGDFSGAYYGIVEDIEIAVSSEATITVGGTPVNLFQTDQFALRATVHLGFAVKDLSKFVKVTDA